MQRGCAGDYIRNPADGGASVGLLAFAAKAAPHGAAVLVDVAVRAEDFFSQRPGKITANDGFFLVGAEEAVAVDVGVGDAAAVRRGFDAKNVFIVLASAVNY